jgi:hypothetical protein
MDCRRHSRPHSAQKVTSAAQSCSDRRKLERCKSAISGAFSKIAGGQIFSLTLKTNLLSYPRDSIRMNMSTCPRWRCACSASIDAPSRSRRFNQHSIQRIRMANTIDVPNRLSKTPRILRARSSHSRYTCRSASRHGRAQWEGFAPPTEISQRNAKLKPLRTINLLNRLSKPQMQNPLNVGI